jgi:glycosyltransferase involved in cell wall biosynthesis
LTGSALERRSRPPTVSVEAPHLLHVVSSFAVGGVPVRIARIISEMGLRYRHTILSLDGRFDCVEQIPPEVSISTARFDMRGSHSLALRSRRREIAKRRPDMLLTYNWATIDWAMANRFLALTPHLHHEDGFGPEEARTQLRRRVLYRRLALGHAFKIVVPSRTLMDIAVNQWGFDPSRLRYLPNGVNVDSFPSARSEASMFARQPGEIIVGTLATLRREKNISRLIRAVAGCHDDRIRLVVAGEGYERAALEAEAHAILGERALFVGSARPEVVLPQFDIFGLSSDTEQMPVSILEAMAAGLPIVTTDVGDVPLMTATENQRFIVPREDEAALASAITLLTADATLRAQVGRLNRMHVRAAYPWQRTVDGYTELYARSACPPSGQRGPDGGSVA